VTGAVTGGLAGALVDAGVDPDAAHYYDELVREGGVLVTVQADEAQVPLARDVLARHGGDLRDSGAAATGRGPVVQSRGTDPGSVGAPDPQPHIGDDPGIVDTPYRTTTGMTGFAEPAPATTPAPDPVPRPAEEPVAATEPRPRRSGGPPII
jgi:hypothetical protein